MMKVQQTTTTINHAPDSILSFNFVDENDDKFHSFKIIRMVNKVHMYLQVRLI